MKVEIRKWYWKYGIMEANPIFQHSNIFAYPCLMSIYNLHFVSLPAFNLKTDKFMLHQDNVIQSIEMNDGKTITLETGMLARQADGSVVVKMGDTMLLATVVSSQKHKEGADFMPLSVDYQEKFAASGRIPGGFLRRESRLSDYEILISRLVDRALRPLFPEDFHSETQVLISMISSDKNIMPDSLAALAASTALTISDIPFKGPISEVRVAKINGNFVINPLLSEIPSATLDLMVAATKENIIMVEGEMKEVSEDEILDALKFAHTAIIAQCNAQLALREKCGNKPKRVYTHEENDTELKKNLEGFCREKLLQIAKSFKSKQERSDSIKALKEEFEKTITDYDDKKKFMVDRYYHSLEKEVVRNFMLSERVRLDGRKSDEIRKIWCSVNCLPSPHGSAIFTRGETQSLTSVTLGTKLDEQLIDGAMFKGYNKFYLHYNFPAFSTGEVKPSRGPGRREIGHGNLAMRSLKSVLPKEDENPYTIRIVSDILESNGSSSMATVCAGTLALMDCGIQIKAPVSGIAMGLITDEQSGKYMILSDILGDEDHLGDMDFKVTGTQKGIVACQMDIKMGGIKYEVLSEALNQAKKGRLFILEEMMKTISKPNADLKPHAPRIIKIEIDQECIGDVIGPGGKIIQQMQRETKTVITIEDLNNRGVVTIASPDRECLEAAQKMVMDIVGVPEIGTIYNGTVRSIMPYGAFVEIMPKKDGLLHVSEIAWERVQETGDFLKVGQKIEVKLIDIDKFSGKMKLSRKALLPRPATFAKNN